MADHSKRNSKIKASVTETLLKRREQVCKVYTCKVDKSHLSKLQKEQLDGMRRELKWYWNDIINKSDKKVVGEENIVQPWKYMITSKKVDVWNPATKSYETREPKYAIAQSMQKLQTMLCSNIRTLASLKKKGLKVGRIKRIGELNLIEFKQNFKILSSRAIKVPGISGNLKLNGLKQFYDIPNLELAADLKIRYDWANDDYYVIFCTYQPKTNIKIVNKQGEIGIDMGCETSFALSDGRKFDYEFAESDRMKRLQRKLDRQIFKTDKHGKFIMKEAKCKNGKKINVKVQKEKRSNNSRRTNAQLKKAYNKLNNRKKDARNKFLSVLKGYETIVIQDEQLSNWQKAGHGKKISHSILGSVKSELMKWDNVVVLGKRIPTTRMCTVCGCYHDAMTVKDRIFKCDCGVNMDRDVHAAQNMLWFYENNIGVGRTDFKRVEVARLATEALNC